MEQGDLEQQFQASLEQHVKKAGSVAGKEASGLLKEIAEEGALKLVKRYVSVISQSKSLSKVAQWHSVMKKFPNTKAFSDKVAERGRPDLTLERLITSPQWRTMFEENELGEAWRRRAVWEGRKTQSRSEELLETLRDGRPEESDDAEEAEWARRMRDFVRQFADSKVTFGNKKYSELERSSPLFVETWLDEYWSEEILKQIPRIVKRGLPDSPWKVAALA